MKMDNNKNHNKYAKFLKNKRVIIVGPSYHTKGYKKAEFVESYDIVIRMNLGFRVESEKVRADIGTKINIWYCSFSEYFFKHKIITSKVLKKIKKDELKWISFIYSGRRKGGLRLLNKANKESNIPIYFVNKSYYDSLYDKTNRKISSGMMTIYDLLQFDIKELYIMGISFYNTDFIGKKRTYYSGYQKNIIYTDPKKIIHNSKVELGLFSNLCNNDNRINYDDVLDKILVKYRNVKK